MKQINKQKVLTIILSAILFFFCSSTFAFDRYQYIKDTTPTSSREEATVIINRISSLTRSINWPNIDPRLFLENIKKNINEPLSIYEGSYINFCGYAAISYIPLHYDPVGYLKFITELYSMGKAYYGKVLFQPPPEVMNAAGLIKFKGKLDINHADQMWFLSLADHFKGYINRMAMKYHQGDERTFWAAVDFAKFNRMIKTLFNYHVHSVGSDIIRPKIKDVYAFLKNKLQAGGITFLYVDNYILTLKKHHFLRPAFPTHFLVLLDINYSDGLINMTYWDYGFRTFVRVTPSFLKKILFGVSHCTKITL